MQRYQVVRKAMKGYISRCLTTWPILYLAAIILFVIKYLAPKSPRAFLVQKPVWQPSWQQFARLTRRARIAASGYLVQVAAVFYPLGHTGRTTAPKPRQRAALGRRLGRKRPPGRPVATQTEPANRGHAATRPGRRRGK